MTKIRRAWAALALALTAATTVPAIMSAPASALPRGYPKVVLTDAASGQPFDMSTIAAANKPTLLWFWAPH